MRKTPGSAPKESHRELLTVQAVAQSVAGDLKVVPGRRWGYFYTDGTPLSLAEGILNGSVQSAEAAVKMKPQALIYDQSLLVDPEAKEYIVPTVRASAHFVAHANFERTARLVEACKEKELSARQILALSDTLSENALYQDAFRRYGTTGAKDIKIVAANRAELIAEVIPELVGLDKVMKVLQLQSLVQDLRCGSQQLLSVMGSLSEAEKDLVTALTPQFRQFTGHYDELTWQALLQPILAMLPPRVSKLEPAQSSESTESSDEAEVDDHEAIAPEDQDEYETPPLPPEPPANDAPSEQREQQAETVFFRIAPKLAGQPPLGGYYLTGRSSFYDRDQKTWSKRKQLQPYVESTLATDRYSMSGNLKAGLTAIPLPHGYGVITASSPDITFVQDQYGCIYAQTSTPLSCQIEFGKLQANAVTIPPVAADLERLYLGLYNQQIEKFLQSVNGDNLTKAIILAKWLKIHKSYPKDLKAAHAVQHALRTQSTGANYLPTLASAPELECYSTATLFVDWLRRLGVPARLVSGHMIDKAKRGECLITTETGHAWAEIWDGSEWVRIDATPPKRKEENEDKDNATSKGESSEPMAKPQNESAAEVPSEKSLSDKVQDRQDAQAQQIEQSISEAEMNDADQQLQQMQEAMDKAQEQKQQMKQQIDKSTSFEELEEKKKEIAANEQLFDDMKEDLEEQAEEKKESMKEDLQEKLDKLAEEGFLDEEKAEQLKQQIEQEEDAKRLDRLAKEVEEQSRLEQEYERLVEEVRPLVDEWYEYFLEVLPKKEDPDIDEDTLAKSSHLNRRALTRPRTLVTGLMRNPMQFRESLIPKFVASIVVDVSGSMAGAKLAIARKTVVFYAELFSRISRNHDYLKFAISIFSDFMTLIKGYDQAYDENNFYDFDDGSHMTIKARIMKSIQTDGGTNMLTALQKASEDLSAAVDGDQEYASALYLLGDGDDTCGNQDRIKALVSTEGQDNRGEHMYAAMVLGGEHDRQILANLFGDNRTAVADSFEELIRVSMEQFKEDITTYLEGKR